MRHRTLASTVVAVVLIAAAGCSSDGTGPSPSATSPASDASAASGASTPASLGPALSPGVVPAKVADITAAADVRALVVSVGFPAAWPMPDGLVAADVLGMLASQTSGEAGTDATFSLTFRLATADLDATAKQWYDAADAVFGVGPHIGTGKVGSGAQAGLSYSGGSDDEPAGRVKVTVSPVDAGSIAVQVEYEVVVSGAPALQFSPSTLAALPSIVACVPELVQASFVRYDAPNSSPGVREFTSIFQGACPSRATFDSTVSWAVGRDGTVTQDEDSIEVTNTTGPDGESLHVGASAAGSLRIDTTAAVPVG